VTGELVAAGVVFLTHREKFVAKFSVVLVFFSLPTPPRDHLIDFWSLFLEHSEDGPHTPLNGGAAKIC
jgi:hypothetical protein